MSKFQSDALRPSALPTAQLGQPSSSRTNNPTSASSLQDDLQKTYEDWNKRIDTEVQGLASGLQDLVDLANIGETPSPHAHATTSLNLQLRTSQIIRGIQNLRDITHDLKLTLLLSDEVSLTQRRDHEARLVRAEIEETRRKVGVEVVRVLDEASGLDKLDQDEKGDEDKSGGKKDGSEVVAQLGSLLQDGSLGELVSQLPADTTAPDSTDSDDEDMEEV